MKTNTLFILFMIAGFSIHVNAQSTGNVRATAANANLLVAMSLSQEAPLNFGSSLLSNTEGGTVTLPSNSYTRSYTGGVENSLAGAAPQFASYVVNGTGLETYALILPLATTVKHNSKSSGITTMDINTMTARFKGKSADATTSTLSANGTDSFTLGGTLIVQENQISGAYSGTFEVIVNYN